MQRFSFRTPNHPWFHASNILHMPRSSISRCTRWLLALHVIKIAKPQVPGWMIYVQSFIISRIKGKLILRIDEDVCLNQCSVDLFRVSSMKFSSHTHMHRTIRFCTEFDLLSFKMKRRHFNIKVMDEKITIHLDKSITIKRPKCEGLVCTKYNR